MSISLLKFLKYTVYDLCRYINRNGEIVAAEVLTLKPSAELSDNQSVELPKSMVGLWGLCGPAL